MLLAKSATVSQDISKNFLTTNYTDDENEEDQGPRMTRKFNQKKIIRANSRESRAAVFPLVLSMTAASVEAAPNAFGAARS